MKTLVLIHGWDNNNYTKYGHTDAWHNREELVNELSKYFKVVKLNLPGFCGEPEPDAVWKIEDYAEYFQNFLVRQKITPDLVLGYSFGAAVATKWKSVVKSSTKLALVSPAISRAYKRKTFVQNFFFLKKLIPNFLNNLFRDYYLKKIGNQFYIDGTNFLKGSYLNIVKIDLSDELKKIYPDSLLIIFGANDTATPPKNLINKIAGTLAEKRIVILENGAHNIAKTHFKEISNLLKKFLSDENNNRNSQESLANG